MIGFADVEGKALLLTTGCWGAYAGVTPLASRGETSIRSKMLLFWWGVTMILSWIISLRRDGDLGGVLTPFCSWLGRLFSVADAPLIGILVATAAPGGESPGVG